MTAMGRHLFVLTSLLTLLAKAGTARATDIDRRENEARAACLSGDYAKGVAILSQLFVETKDADFIYNQGRCFEQNHRYDDAIARFEEFLRVAKKLSKSDKARAEQHIADCRKSLEKQSTTRAPAAETSGTEDKVRAARKACLTADPTAGVAILTDLYLDTKDPNHLFNQGRCFEQNQRYREAIGRFREYLEKAKDLSAEEKADTQRHIATCDSYLQQEPAAVAKIQPSRIAEQESVVAESRPAEVITVAGTEDSGREGRGRRIGGAVVAAVGVAGLMTGVVLNVKVNGMSSDLEGDWNTGKNSTRESYKTAGWIAYGAGVACVVGGAVLYYFGWRRGEHGNSVAVVPAAGPNMGGASFVGTF